MNAISGHLEKAADLRRQLKPAGWLGTGKVSDYADSLTFLLPVLEWRGSPNQICEALPHMPEQLDRFDVINTMINLGYKVSSASINLHNTDARLIPCFFVCDQDDSPLVILPDENKELVVYKPADDSVTRLSEYQQCSGTLFTFEPLTKETSLDNRITVNPDKKVFRWFRALIHRFDSIFLQTFFVSFLINILALASSLFVMTVYDKVIGSRSVDTLRYLVFGTLLAMCIESLLRYLRARSFAYFGVRMDAIISSSIFERLLFLPPRLIEGSSIPSQVTRIKDFDSIREFFSSPTGISVIELPFTLIFIITIAVIGGSMAFIPLILGGCYALLALVMLPRIRQKTEQGAMASVRKQAMLVETMKKIRPIKLHGLGDKWSQRFQLLSGQAAYTGFSSAFLGSLIEAFAYGLSVIAGVTTLSVGIFLVWSGNLTTGGLIACMILTWRVMAPMQSICNSLNRIRYIFRSIGQVHKMLRSPPESAHIVADPTLFRIKGDLTYNGVGLRYSSERGAVFSGLSLEIKQGEIVAITGPSGAGKSSLLKLTNGLYSPQMGSILIDGLDIRQSDPVELRKKISYTPQLAELFHGTIEKNLRMVKPDATDAELIEAITWAGALEQVKMLANELDTFIGDYRTEQLSSTFAFQLTLARSYLRDAPIMLFDEFPSAVVNSSTGILFLEYLEAQQGKKTIFFITDRKEEVLLANRLIYLPGNGQVLAGDPQELLEALLP
jgi:ATP-binding cassette subfamily C protein/ATP-binding cassette subfamily C protein LapB